jgi:hypothetical protein
MSHSTSKFVTKVKSYIEDNGSYSAQSFMDRNSNKSAGQS